MRLRGRGSRFLEGPYHQVQAAVVRQPGSLRQVSRSLLWGCMIGVRNVEKKKRPNYCIMICFDRLSSFLVQCI